MTDHTDPSPDPSPDNVVPPNELERRRRVLACIEDLADLSKDVADRVLELRELGVASRDWIPMLAEYAPKPVQELVVRYGNFAYGFIDGFLDARAAGAKTGVEGMMAAFAGHALRATPVSPGDLPITGYEHPADLTRDGYYTESALRMKRLIERLFAEAPKMTDASGKPDPTQAPALECHVMLKGGGAINGALSVTPEGTLRLLSPNQIGAKPVMVEHFFDYEQVADIALFREVKASEGSRIITS